MISSDNEVTFEEDFDFGFTAVSEKNLEIQYLDDRAQQLYNKVLPFLRKLAKDADKNPYLHWPNRKEQIEKFILQLDNILRPSGVK